MMNCGSSRFWTRSGPRLANATRDPRASADVGTCQVHGPTVVICAGLATSEFPQTHESRFCGDWKGREGGGDDGERVLPFPARRAA